MSVLMERDFDGTLDIFIEQWPELRPCYGRHRNNRRFMLARRQTLSDYDPVVTFFLSLVEFGKVITTSLSLYEVQKLWVKRSEIFRHIT